MFNGSVHEVYNFVESKFATRETHFVQNEKKKNKTVHLLYICMHFYVPMKYG